LLYGISFLTDPAYATWLLKMTLAALNLHVGQQQKHWPDMGNWKLWFDFPETLVLSIFGVSIPFLIFSRRLQLFSSWSHIFSTLTNYDIFTFGYLGLRWPNKDFLAFKIDYTFWEYLPMRYMSPIV
jgi:hypothetical protein